LDALPNADGLKEITLLGMKKLVNGYFYTLFTAAPNLSKHDQEQVLRSISI